MTETELCQELSIDRPLLNAWLDEGLPSSGEGGNLSFDPNIVADWLVAMGYADRIDGPTDFADFDELVDPSEIVHTCSEVAAYFDRHVSTIFRWVRSGMPCIPGSPGQRNGYFPLRLIDAWLKDRRARRGCADVPPLGF